MLLFISVWYEIGINIKQIILIKNEYEEIYCILPYGIYGLFVCKRTTKF